MQWLGIAIALLAMFGAGIFVTWLWQRRSNRVLREDVRKRIEADNHAQLEQEQSRTGKEALQQWKKNFGGGGQDVSE